MFVIFLFLYGDKNDTIRWLYSVNIFGFGGFDLFNFIVFGSLLSRFNLFSAKKLFTSMAIIFILSIVPWIRCQYNALATSCRAPVYPLSFSVPYSFSCYHINLLSHSIQEYESFILIHIWTKCLNFRFCENICHSHILFTKSDGLMWVYIWVVLTLECPASLCTSKLLHFFLTR